MAGRQEPSSLSEQLQPVMRELRQRHSTVQPVSQVFLRLRAEDGVDRFSQCVKEILRWMSRRSGRPLPPAAWELKSFEVTDVGAQPTAAVSLTDPRFWAARLDDADKNVAQRTWTTEVAVGREDNGDVLFGTRLVCAARGDAPAFSRSVPGFVTAVAKLGGELDGEPALADGTRQVATEADVDNLVDLLESPDRHAPVIVVALPEGSTDSSDAVLDAAVLEKRLPGAAHVRILTAPASFHLTDRTGKELSVFRSAVRVYWPGFNRGRDYPMRHPLYLPQRITEWAEGGIEGFMQFLSDQVLSLSVRGGDRDGGLPAFSTVRQMAAQREREEAHKRGGTDKEILENFAEDNRRLKRELAEQKALYEYAQTENGKASEEIQEAKSQIFALRQQIKALGSRLKSLDDRALDSPIPTTLDGLDAWVSEYMAGAVILHSRALGGAKKSEYSDPQLVYRALLMLRDRYVPMRTEGGQQLKSAFESEARALGLENSPVGEALKQYPALYRVEYGGKPRAIDWHLKKGDSREPRHCFRLYYFWDDENECVVVGWLTSHLRNSLT